MRRRIDRYRNTEYLKRMMYAVIGVLGIGILYKGNYILYKIDIVDKATDLHHKKAWIEAEACLREVKTYTHFKYQETKVEQLLNELQWITNYNEKLKQIQDDVVGGKQDLDYDRFYSGILNYQTIDFESLEGYQREYYTMKYSLETTIDDGWVQFKGYMQNMLEQPTESAKYNWAKEHIFEIPEQYFSLPKNEVIQGLFETCDQQLYEKILIKSSGLKEKLDNFNEIYKINSQYGYQTQWLTSDIIEYVRDEIKSYAETAYEEGLQNVRKHSKTSLREMEDASVVQEEIKKFFSESKQEIKRFYQIIQDYNSIASHFYYDSEIENIQKRYIELKEDEIQTLIESEYYDEAINWYRELSNLQSFSQEIKEIERTKLFKDPVVLIEDKLGDYAQYQVGWNALAGERYMVAINNRAMQCEVYPLIQEEEYTSYRKFIFPLEEILGSDVMYHWIKENTDADIELNISGDLIGIKTSTKGQEELAIFRVEENYAENLFYGIGETIEWDETMEEIRVIQSYDEEEPMVIYHYDSEVYLKEEVLIPETPDEELTEEELTAITCDDENLDNELQEEQLEEDALSYDLDGII